ncbi:hypothetical protein PMIN03_011196 [Paraphaeosphaeria minitans]
MASIHVEAARRRRSRPMDGDMSHRTRPACTDRLCPSTMHNYALRPVDTQPHSSPMLGRATRKQLRTGSRKCGAWTTDPTVAPLLHPPVLISTTTAPSTPTYALPPNPNAHYTRKRFPSSMRRTYTTYHTARGNPTSNPPAATTTTHPPSDISASTARNALAHSRASPSRRATWHTSDQFFPVAARHAGGTEQ